MTDKKEVTDKEDIKDVSDQSLDSWLLEKGIESYRAQQIKKWIYIHQKDSFEDMTNIGKEMRLMLSDFFVISRLKKEKVLASDDGSKKYLFKTDDDNYIESVLIPEKQHYTLCISTQAGCAQGCRFCVTGKGGFKRNLTKGEIIGQVRDIIKESPELKISNIVLMGMGEPLANYQNVLSALKTVMDSGWGLGFSSRKVTLSTSGMVPMITKLGSDIDVNLAVSLNAADNKTRSFIMPINDRYSIDELMEACKKYPLKPRRRITFEYILIKDINDSLSDAKKLAKMLKPIKSKINLIPFNEHKGCDFKRPDESAVLSFQDVLIKQGLTVIIRKSKGSDIMAACGQLGAGLL